MTIVAGRITVSPDGTMSGRAPRDVPPGEHPVAITVQTPPGGKPFTMAGFPVHNLGWDDSISLGREALYDDEGRLR